MTLYECPECGFEMKIWDEKFLYSTPIHACKESDAEVRMIRVEELVAVTSDGSRHRFTVPGEITRVEVDPNA